MPFGLTTAPATFQRLMHIVLQQENWHKCLIYLDDILIFGRSIEEHLERLKSVLQRIREANLKLSPSKCFFLKKEVDYLGHVVTANGIKTDPKKIEKVKNWPHPKTIKQLRSFLGFCGYYRRFIKNYAELARPLEALCVETPNEGKEPKNKKNMDILGQWSDSHESVFHSLKSALTSAPVLSYPTETDKFILDTDASNSGIGAVLSQLQNGVERVIAYASRKLSKAERRYCVTRKELLAVYAFVKHFRHYIFGRPFQIRTDHKALLWMLNWKKPNTSQYCLWKAELEMYDMEVTYRPGNIHTNADALSRLPNCHQCELKHENPVTRRYVKVFGSTSSGSGSVNNKSQHMILRVTSEVLPQLQWDISHDPELGVICALMRAGKINQIEKPHAIQTGSSKLKEFWKQKDDLRLRGDILYLVKDNLYRLVVPVASRKELLAGIHSSVGHAGIDKVTYVMREHYYWPGMEEDIRMHINNCLECQMTKPKPNRDRAPFQPTLVGEPFEKVAIDISGPFHPSKHGYRYILAIIDYFSKYPVLVPLKRIDAETIAEKMFHNWISIFGAPKVIHSDRGANFESEVFKKQCELLNIKKTKTSPYYPQADGLVERLFRTIKPLISATVRSRKISWCESLPIVEMGLRCSVQSTIGFSPFEVLFGKKMRLPIMWQYPSISHTSRLWPSSSYIENLQDNLEHVRDEVMKHMGPAIQRQADYYNRNRTHTIINIGDSVLVKVEGKSPGKFPKYKYQGPFQVINKNNYWSYKLKEMPNGKVIDRNYNQLRKLEGDHWRPRIPTNGKSSISRVSTSISQQPEQLERQATPMQSDQEYVHLRPQPSQIQQPVQFPQTPLEYQQSPAQSQQLREIPRIELQLRSTQTPLQARYPQRHREPPNRLF
jgi:transposase InsO family protein